ncbi:MAG TPA: hypothetical protein VMB25_15230 [Bryobacteraceae bacterium]|nr:hypothetical protein [Bryobacteraceae bacterium]
MSPRRLLRIVLSVIIIALIWSRAAREWRYESGLWLTGAITLSLILLLVVLYEVSSVFRKKRRPADDVPKRPLGLDT